MHLTAGGTARAAVAVAATVVVGVVVMELGRAVVDALQPDREQLVAAVEQAVPPDATLMDDVRFSEGVGLGNLYRWFPPIPDQAGGTVVGADIEEVGRHLAGLGLEPTSYGSLPAYDRGLLQVQLADVGAADGDVRVVAQQDAAWWMFLHGPVGALAGLTTGWKIGRGRRREPAAG